MPVYWINPQLHSAGICLVNQGEGRLIMSIGSTHVLVTVQSRIVWLIFTHLMALKALSKMPVWDSTASRAVGNWMHKYYVLTHLRHRMKGRRNCEKIVWKACSKELIPGGKGLGIGKREYRNSCSTSPRRILLILNHNCFRLRNHRFMHCHLMDQGNLL